MQPIVSVRPADTCPSPPAKAGLTRPPARDRYRSLIEHDFQDRYQMGLDRAGAARAARWRPLRARRDRLLHAALGAHRFLSALRDRALPALSDLDADAGAAEPASGLPAQARQLRVLRGHDWRPCGRLRAHR